MRIKPDPSDFPYEYAWGNNELRAQLKGRRCRVLASGAMRTVLVEFEDGTKVTTSNRALRQASAQLELPQS